jgi:hypothetical protein
MATTDPPYPYQTERPNDSEWTRLVYQALVANRMTAAVTVNQYFKSAEVSGPCPYCHDEVAFSETLTTVTGETPGYRTELAIMAPRGSQVKPDFVTFTASCRCNGEHAGRPSEVKQGCGINFQVKLRPMIIDS